MNERSTLATTAVADTEMKTERKQVKCASIIFIKQKQNTKQYRQPVKL